MEDDVEGPNEGEDNMTIAWRYKKMKKFESGINSNVKNVKKGTLLILFFVIPNLLGS